MINRYKGSLYLMIITCILLCAPYIIHLIQNGTVENFDSFHAYTYNLKDSRLVRIMNWVIFTTLILIFSVLYLYILKHEKKIFNNRKQIYIFIFIISILFSLILYYIMYDIFYYMGDSWLSAKYGENPYYTSVLDLQNNGIDDEILRNTGPWKHTTSVYGPIWNMISTVLIFFSFGNVSIGLFIFKLSSLILHMLNCHIIYKLTKNRKYVLLYGLNPLVLLEALSNVHNDIYLVTFTLLALFFLIRKKNIGFSLIFLAISVATKYTTALIVPFLLIYIFRDKSIYKRFWYCLTSGIGIIIFVIIAYMPYYRDISIFTNMLVQGEKYSQSILAILMKATGYNEFKWIERLVMFSFLFIYINSVIKILLTKNLKLKEVLNKFNIILLLFIFGVLSSFHEWYIVWLIPTLMWQKKYMRYFIILMTIVSLIYPVGFFITCSDAFIYGKTYSINIILRAAIITGIIYINNKIIDRNKKVVKRS